MRLRILIPVFWILVCIPVAKSQKTDSLFFREKEKMLQEVYNTIQHSEGRSKDTAEITFRDSLVSILKIDGSFYFPFDSLRQIGRITSDDERLVIFTWNIPHKLYNNYYGILQYYSKKHKKTYVYPLIEDPGFLKNTPQATASVIKWPGALYYKIISTKHKGQVYYSVLGFHFNDLLSNNKLIDIIAFDNNGQPFFPRKSFSYQGKMLSRIIFEYAERATMSLNYYEDRKMIIFDHLSPSRPSLEGQYQFYGPDFSFDGFIFKNGIWTHQPDIDIRN